MKAGRMQPTDDDATRPVPDGDETRPLPGGTATARTNDPYAGLDRWVDEHFDEEVRFLQELVRVPTDTPPATTRRTPSAPPNCWRASASTPRSTQCRRRR
jgi:hypothetical protein